MSHDPEIVKAITEQWTPGCYGMQRPFCAVSADSIIIRDINGETNILLCRRGSGRWQEGMWMVSAGGFVDPADESVLVAASREKAEELGGMEVELDPKPFFVGGPVKLNYTWNPSERKAINTGKLAQNAPVVTLNYFSRWIAGEPTPTKEVPETRWAPLRKLMEEECTYAFDMGLVLEHIFRFHKLI